MCVLLTVSFHSLCLFYQSMKCSWTIGNPLSMARQTLSTSSPPPSYRYCLFRFYPIVLLNTSCPVPFFPLDLVRVGSLRRWLRSGNCSYTTYLVHTRANFRPTAALPRLNIPVCPIQDVTAQNVACTKFKSKIQNRFNRIRKMRTGMCELVQSNNVS